MPSYNLAETVHNKLLQQSENRGNDLHIAIVDEFVRAFMQMVKYYQYLKGNEARTGLRKDKLILRVAQCSAKRNGNPKALTEALSKIRSVDKFMRQEPHLEGQEVFGSQKKKANRPFGCKFNSHRPDKVKFSHPNKSLRSIYKYSSTPSDF